MQLLFLISCTLIAVVRGNYGNQVGGEMGMRGSSVKCTLDAPCYQTILNIVMDGEKGFNSDDNGFRRHFDLVGLERDEVVQLARKALKWFKEEYGLTFEMSDLEAITGNFRKTSTDGKASLMVNSFTPASRYRVYTAKVGDHIQLMNAPVSIAGWSVTFTDQQDYVSTGKRNITIPGSASLPYGYYIIKPCVNQPVGHCQNIINPDNPTDNIIIQWEVDEYFVWVSEYSVLHATVRSELLGEGHARGYFPGTGAGWQNMVFSGYSYPYRKY